MQPLSELPAAGVRALLFDLDGTLVDERLSPVAYAALAQAQQAGLRTIAVTGRPAGWCDLIARWWPLDGVVGEVALTGENYLASGIDMRSHSSSSTGRATPIESVMAVPMSINEQRTGVICAVNKRDRAASFTTENLFLLSTLSSHVAIGGVLVQVYEEMGDQQRIVQELLLARESGVQG